MNRVYSLVWNRALHSVQVASELASSAGGRNVACASGTRTPRRHLLALACIAALALGAFALPAWSATCTVNGIAYTNCTVATSGGPGLPPNLSTGMGGAGGYGSSSNHGGPGGDSSNGRNGFFNGHAGQGTNGSGGGGGNAYGGAAGGTGGLGAGNGIGGGGGGNTAPGSGAGGGFGDAGVGGGGGGGGAYFAEGGGGGGGGALGATVSGAYSLESGHAVVGGDGGAGGLGIANPTVTKSIAEGGAGGGGGAGMLVDSGTFTNRGAVSGGAGGAGGQGQAAQFGVSVPDAPSGGGGAGVLLASGTTLVNTGAIFGGAGGNGGVGVASEGSSIITTDGIISGGLSGNGTHADAIDLAGGNNQLTLEVGATVTGNIVASGSDNTLTLGDDTLGATTGGSATLASDLSGFSSYSKTGTGTWTLTGTSTGAVPWTIAQGTLNAGSANVFGAGTVTMDAGTVLGFAADKLTLANAFVLNGDPTVTLTGGQTETLSGPISDGTTPGALELDGDGTGRLIVSHPDNTYSGGTTVNAGMLEAAASGTLGTGSVTVNGAAGMNSTLQVDSGAALANHVVLSSGAATSADCGGTSLACATLNSAGVLDDTVDNATVVSTGGYAVVGNTGTISGVRSGVSLGAGGSVTNSGTGAKITSSVDISGSSGTVVNNDGGYISGSVDAVDLNHGGSIVNGIGSAINGYAAGVSIGGGAGKVSNNGTITGPVTGVFLYAGGSLSNGTSGIISGAYLAAGGTISNNGTIASGYAVQLANGGTVTNFAGGTIDGSAQGVKLLKGGTIANAAGGTIESTGTSVGNCYTGSDCAIFAASASDNAALGGALTLSNAGTITGNVQMDPTAANVTTLTAGGSIAGDLDIGTNTAATLTLDGNAGTSQLYSQAVTGTTAFDGALTKAGGGTWVIDGNDLSNVSGTTINAGTLQIGDGGAAGSIGNGNVADDGALVFDRSNALVFAGAISGSGTLTQVGTGTLTLDGANTYAGLTEVKAGTLLVGDATRATASIAGDVQVDNGATLGGFGTVGTVFSTTEIQSGGVLSPGAGTGSIGTLNVDGDLTLDQGSALDVDLGAPGTPNPFVDTGSSDSVNVGGTLTFNGGSTLNLAEAGGMGPGLYNLASYGTLTTTGCSFSSGTACLTLGTLPSGTQASYFTLVNNTQGNQIDLYNTAGQALDIWAPNGTASPGGKGSWSATSQTWTNAKGDGPSTMFPSSGFAIFQGKPGTVTVSDANGQASATGLQFAVNGYTLTGDALQLVDDPAGNAPVIEVGDGSAGSASMTATISNELDTTGGFTKTGAGTLAIVGTKNAAISGAVGGNVVAVQAGTLQIGSTALQGNAAKPDSEFVATPVMAPDTSLVLINGELSGGGATAGSAVVKGQDFDLTTQTTGTAVSAIVGLTATLPGVSPAVGAGAAISGDGFTATFTGNTAVLAAGALLAGQYAATDTPAITGSGFHVINDSNMGSLIPGGVVAHAPNFGITGGTGFYAATGTAGAGGAGISGTGFTVANDGGIYGGAGGGTSSGTPGAGGAGIGGTAFTLTNTGKIIGGEGGAVYAGGARTGVVTGLGGAGVSSLGGATVINEGMISGGQSGAGLAQADAIDFTGGGNTLELVAGHPGTFNGAIVVTRAAGDAADTLDLGGDTGSDSFDVAQLSSGGTFDGFNAEAKSGGSTWTLTGTTAAVTPWEIGGGTLSVSSDANLGAAAGTLTFNGGTLENTAAFTTARGITLTGAGTLQTDANLTAAGVIGGAGALTKTGSATLTLPGANSFTGGTSINAGEVDVGNNAALGTGRVAMAAGTTLGFATDGLSLANAFALSGDPTFDVAAAGQTDAVGGAITDGTAPGVLQKTGAGTLVLTGANTFSGGTTISAGTLQVGNGGTSGALGTGAIADNGTLVFDRSDAVALPAGLSGDGALIQQGAGGFTVNGDDSAFAGTTTIEAGTATIGDDSHASASLGGMVNVARGATIQGIGTVGGLDLSGTLSPGGSIGTLHVTGDATFEVGSTFNIEAAPDGKADQLAVGGKATIKGGNTLVMAQPGNWAARTSYAIVTAGGGVSGKFDGVSDDQAFLTPTLAYGANDVTLTLARNDINFGTVAQNPNQRAAAAGIEGLGFGNVLYDAVVKLNAADAQDAFNQTSGEYHASEQTARIDDSRYVREAMNQRLRQGDDDPEATKVGHLTAWAHAWGHWGSVDGDANAAKLSDNGDGLLIGADMPVGTQARVGITGGASRNTLSVRDRSSWGRDTSTWLGAFGGFNVHAFSLRGGVAYAWDQVPTNRQIAFPGYADRLSDNATGSTLTGFVEGAWTFHFTRGTVSPFLNLAHTRLVTGASTEQGGAAALRVYASGENVSFGTLGARGQIDFAQHLNLHGELGWQHAFGDTTPAQRLGFVAGGPAFTEYGVPIAKNAGLGRIGIGWRNGNVAIDANYEGLAGSGVKDQAAKLSVSVRF
ncbi:MAG TPA: autotransporter-associated beta strand repeat-containing protein [Rhodanobacteraceae bacterium]